jgi:protein-S-isoprenylcysteine O-methyltransferase Ste14
MAEGVETVGMARVDTISTVALDESQGETNRTCSTSSFKNSLSNIALALLFFAALIPGHTSRYSIHAADIIWMVGAALMGIFSLIRVPPKTVTVSPRSIAATAGMMILPTLIKPGLASVGLLNQAGMALELIGVIFTQLARVYLGRSFGLLPANRGIVSKGPFRLMRHPIYVGWFVLTLGYAFIYPTPRNFVVIVAALFFMMWRIVQEEELLGLDPEYRAYCEKVGYRLIPWVI